MVGLTGRIEERGEHGGWNSFSFDGLDVEGDAESFSIKDDDLPEGYDWDDFFDYLDDFLDDYDDIDYSNPYGEK